MRTEHFGIPPYSPGRSGPWCKLGDGDLARNYFYFANVAGGSPKRAQGRPRSTSGWGSRVMMKSEYYQHVFQAAPENDKIDMTCYLRVRACRSYPAFQGNQQRWKRLRGEGKFWVKFTFRTINSKCRPKLLFIYWWWSSHSFVNGLDRTTILI